MSPFFMLKTPRKLLFFLSVAGKKSSKRKRL
jgi:hypothetical protein